MQSSTSEKEGNAVFIVGETVVFLNDATSPSLKLNTRKSKKIEEGKGRLN